MYVRFIFTVAVALGFEIWIAEYGVSRMRNPATLNVIDTPPATAVTETGADTRKKRNWVPDGSA